MRAIDTNGLVRILTRDDARQADDADLFISGGAWVSTVVLAEAIWVLGRTYGLGADEQIRSIAMLLRHEHLILDDQDTVSAALELFRARPALGFSDCLILESARKAGHLPLGTFDCKLAKVEGTELIGGKSTKQPPHRARSRRS